MAAVDWGSTTGCIDRGAATIKCLEPLFQNVVTALIAFAGVALFIVLLVGGFKYLFAGGDQKKIEAARGTLTNAVIGLVVIVLAYLILKTISVFTGLPQLLEFKVNVK